MVLPNDRSGNTITLYQSGGNVIDDGSILDLVPDFHLNETTATLFGDDWLWRYEFPFEQTDRKIISAVEYDDFAGAILGKHPID